MSTCDDVKAFNSAYPGLIKAIGNSDPSAIKAEYLRWLNAREKVFVQDLNVSCKHDFRAKLA